MASLVDERVEIPITGMTCASCAARIERGLGKLDGVTTATVNYATERATVSFNPAATTTAAFRAKIEALGYAVAEAVDDANTDNRLRNSVIIAAAFTAPLLAISMITAWQFRNWEWVAFVLSTPVIAYCGWPFHRSAFMNARHGAATMDTLVSIGSGAAYIWSVVAVTALGATRHSAHAGMAMNSNAPHVYFETGAVIVTLILLGRYFEHRSRRRAGDALRGLLALGAKTARLETGEEIPIGSLEVGDRFIVRPGEQIATDGIVRTGATAIDIAMLTGEPVPVEIGIGDAVFGATINQTGSIVVEATSVGEETALAKIAKLVETAQGSKAQVQRLADQIASIFVPIVMLIALGTLGTRLLLGNPANTAFTAAVAVLIIACPCALGLATPTALMVGTGRGAQLGIVIKGGEVLEATRRIDTVILDKTGTITHGAMRVVSEPAVCNFGSAEAMRLAASAEYASEHPIARAIVDAANRHGLVLATPTSFNAEVGFGVRAIVDGTEVNVGRASMFDAIPPALIAIAESAMQHGQTPVYFGVLEGGQCFAAAVFIVADTIRPQARAGVAALRNLGIEIVMVTGDNSAAARSVADEVGIDQVIADALPATKLDAVRALQADGKRVAVVGDGINDAPALAAADLGIAMGSGTDIAIEAGDLTLVAGDLRSAADAISLARQTLRTIKGNLFWAFAYNVAAIPLAALGLLNPMIAAGTMAGSSIFVVSNSLRLRRFQGIRHQAA